MPTTVIDCTNPCTVTVVHELALPPLQLDVADGSLVAGAILAVWAIGWAFRMVIRSLNVDGVKAASGE